MDKRRHRVAVAAIAAIAVLAPACGAPSAAPGSSKPAPAWVESFSRPLSGWTRHGPIVMARVRSYRQRALAMRARRGSSGTVSHRLPTEQWALSLDLSLPRKSVVELSFGSSATERLRLRRGSAARLELAVANRSGSALGDTKRVSRPNAHLQAVRTGKGVLLAVGRRRFALSGPAEARLVVTVRRGGTSLDDLLATSSSSPSQLLLHRLADLQQRVTPQAHLFGAQANDRLRFGGFWTRGFFAGALWQARDLTKPSDMFRAFALARTTAALGDEHVGSHDLGFVYETSSLAAYRRLCRTAGQRRGARCRKFRSSALTAANRLASLARSNALAGTIPTRDNRPKAEVDTIIDSMMNLPLLYWASKATGKPSFRRLAARHAARVASLLVRADGSTAQSVHFNRYTGKVLRIHTHQGASAHSTWGRGQAWAVYGFTTSAAALKSRALLEVAERTAGWVSDHLPSSGVPPWDYAAGPGALSDRSAGAITAAGLYRLASLCRNWRGACKQPSRWRPLADRMLRADLSQVSRRPPLGFFGGQVGTHGGSSRWDDHAELICGLHYALEAVRLSGSSNR